MALNLQTISENAETVSPATCRAELKRVLDSRTFSKSVRLRELLEYVGICSIENRFDDLSEQQIGMSVFQRPAGYNSTEDTIVRVTARHLRDRLDLYYREEGQNDPLRMFVPKGNYVATFTIAPTLEFNSRPSPFSPAMDLPALSTGDKKNLRNRKMVSWPLTAWLAFASCAGLAIVLPLLVYLHFRPKPEPLVQSTGPEILWRALFTSGRKTLIVPGDAGLDSYIAWEQKSVSLTDYTNQAYQSQVTVSRPPTNKDVPLSVRSVTPMADLRLVSELVRVPDRMGQPQLNSWIEICYARDMVVANTQSNNLILIGPESFNPWVMLYQGALDFYVRWDYKSDVGIVIDRAPKPGEPAELHYDRRLPNQKALTLVALTDNSQGNGRVLIIEGTSMGTTYGALNFLTNEELWRPVIHTATDNRGVLHNFEVLLSNDFVRGGASNTRVVTFHVH